MHGHVVASPYRHGNGKTNELCWLKLGLHSTLLTLLCPGSTQVSISSLAGVNPSGSSGLCLCWAHDGWQDLRPTSIFLGMPQNTPCGVTCSSGGPRLTGLCADLTNPYAYCSFGIPLA